MFPVWKLATTWKQHTSLTWTSHINSVRSVFMPGLSPACRAGWSPKEETPHHSWILLGATSGAIYKKLAMKRKLRMLRNWPHVVWIHVHYRSKLTFIQAKFRCSWPSEPTRMFPRVAFGRLLKPISFSPEHKELICGYGSINTYRHTVPNRKMQKTLHWHFPSCYTNMPNLPAHEPLIFTDGKYYNF